MISKEDFAARRKEFMRRMQPNSIAVLFASPLHALNHDTDLPYRPESNFRYLTNFLEPEAALVLAPGRKEGEVVLFNKKRDPKFEIWNGKLAGQEGAVKDFGMDQSFAIEELETQLPELFNGRDAVYHAFIRDKEHTPMIVNAIENLARKVRMYVKAPTQILDANIISHEMRLIKSPAEIEMMRTVGKISAQAHIKAMKACKPDMMEFQVEAVINQHLLHNNCKFTAYCSIVGGGENACCLHYIDNTKKLKSGDLLLIDAGGEYHGYCGDITRTFPVNGKFTHEQKLIYDAVLKAQEDCLAILKPGLEYPKMQEITVRSITESLVKLGILKGDIETLIAEKKYFQFYMHRSGHWLGMDVHDVGAYKDRRLAPGMVLTVEPGIYISPADNVDKKWHNIGIRIEDDILITETGYEILTPGMPRTTDEVEAVMAHA